MCCAHYSNIILLHLPPPHIITCIGTWNCPAITGEIPPPCALFTFTGIDERRAVLFGGFNEKQRHMNHVYIIDLHTMVIKVYNNMMVELKFCI